MSKPLAASDPHVKLPAAVLAAGKRSDDLVKAQTVTPEGNQPPPAPPPPAPPPPAPPAPQANQEQPRAVDWEGRYNSMYGRFQQAERNSQQMAAQLSEMQRLIASLQAAPNKPAPADVRFVTPKEEQEYGTEFLDVVGKRAKEIVSPEVAALREKVAQLEAQVGTVERTTVVNEQQKMYNYLDTNISNWREINQSPGFKEWINLPDPYSGATRYSLLMSAYNANQSGRVLAFFRGYLADEAATRPADQSTQRTSAQPSKVDLASLAAPGRAKQAAVPTPADKPTFTRAEVSKFYHDVTTGAYAGRDADRVAREAEIFAAGREGRVV